MRAELKSKWMAIILPYIVGRCANCQILQTGQYFTMHELFLVFNIPFVDSFVSLFVLFSFGSRGGLD